MDGGSCSGLLPAGWAAVGDPARGCCKWAGSGLAVLELNGLVLLPRCEGDGEGDCSDLAGEDWGRVCGKSAEDLRWCSRGPWSVGSSSAGITESKCIREVICSATLPAGESGP